MCSGHGGGGGWRAVVGELRAGVKSCPLKAKEACPIEAKEACLFMAKVLWLK